MWLRICRNKIESEPASLAAAAALQVSRFGVMGRNHTRNFLWDPAKETIVGDAEAARMPDRPLRRPWTL
jgi:hypothetical protein